MKPFTSKNIVLENQRVVLLPFKHERNLELKNIIFHEDIWRFMGSSIKNDIDFDEYISSTLKENELAISYAFIIIDKASNKVAGSTRYGNIDMKSEKCEIGWTWFGKEFQGTGLNKACKYELLNYGFEQLKLRRIQFSVDLENIRSQKAIEKLGATKEGLFRNNYIDIHNNSKDDVYYSIVLEDWKNIKESHFSELL
ncbi:MAG: hypothetical protein COA50_09695 [Flavobacteriaceae bacterium]|nr:MAG: hypothetical protein COA50_09695 [Flavobacteriaceae bacterium]